MDDRLAEAGRSTAAAGSLFQRRGSVPDIAADRGFIRQGAAVPKFP
jgi:hypothetical protein